jgi:ketosteroid isomerase-like protein
MRQHQVTNFQISVDGDTATSRSQVRAIHLFDGAVMEQWATYHHRLRRDKGVWKITYLRADLTYETGQHLTEMARARASERKLVSA